MKVIITGGAGFIGSHLVDRLLDEGYDITVVDNLSRGKIINLEHCIDQIKFYSKDLSIESLPKDNYDIVYDFAARVFGVRTLYLDEFKMLSQNIAITTNILSSIIKLKPKRYVYASSSCIYDFEGCPIPHREDVTNIPNTGYGMSKMIGEQLVKIFSNDFNMEYSIARIFNVYGKRESFYSPHVIPDFIKTAHRLSKRKELEPYETFPIFGDGKQTRAFTYVTDTVDALYKMGTMEEARNQIFNVGISEEIMMIDLARKICKMFNIEPVFKLLDVHPLDIRRRCADNTKITSILEWKPKIDLDTGLKLVKDWYLDYVDKHGIPKIEGI